MARAARKSASSATATPPQKKQAVVVIHGMGEQRPLETLRDFVDTVYARDPSFAFDGQERGKNPVSIVPDEATGSAELRRITTHPGKGPRTDFYEFYWADIMDGTPVEQVTSWIAGLLLRSPMRVPQRLQVQLAWVLLWVLTLVFIASALVVAFPEQLKGPLGFDAIAAFLQATKAWIGLGILAIGAVILGSDLLASRGGRNVSFRFFGWLVAGLVVLLVPGHVLDEPRALGPVIAALVGWVLTIFVAPYFGDVVRYVRATPRTVGRRAEVRERGLKLLETLHDKRKDGSDEPYYDRIVIVAHSLGTIIAYDLLQHFWQKHGPVHTNAWDPSASEAEMLAVDAFVEQAWSPDLPADKAQQIDLEGYQRAQAALNAALRRSALQWRITDLVTLGSPLVHAEFLMFDSRDDLRKAFAERSVASSPPRPAPAGTNDTRGDLERPSMLYDEIKPDGTRRGPFAHFAAPFAAVRWTNICDENWCPALGDLVSGPMRRDFGPAIDDHIVTIRRHGWWPVADRIFTHTLYWRWEDAYDARGLPEHIRLLREALDLGRILGLTSIDVEVLGSHLHRW